MIEPGHAGTTSLLNNDNEHLYMWSSCNDYIHDTAAAYLTGRWGRETFRAYQRTGIQLDPSSPRIAISWKSAFIEENNAKFLELIGEIEDKIGIKDKTNLLTTIEGKIVSCSIYVFSQYWLKSPVSLSMLAMLLRIARIKEIGESFEGFVNRASSIKTEFFVCKQGGPTSDINYINIASQNGNLQGVINGTLKCMNREGFCDYFLNSHGRGISGYSHFSDKFPMSFDEIAPLKRYNVTQTFLPEREELVWPASF